MSSKPGSSSLVVVPLFISFMHPTVTLNCKTDFATKEINYVVTELVLTPVFEAEALTISQELPEEGFSRRLLASQRAR